MVPQVDLQKTIFSSSEINCEVRRRGIKMFYEFNNYPYYALISAKSEEEAISYYNEQVCELEEEDAESHPDLVTKEYVMAKIKSVKCDSEYEEEKAIKELDIEVEESYLVLIDGSLI